MHQIGALLGAWFGILLGRSRAGLPAAALLVMAVSARAAAQRTGRESLSIVRGSVFDSLRGKPLANALVVTEAGRSATTDDRGRFRFDSVPRGVRTFTVEHAILDTIGLAGIARRAAISDAESDVRLAVPSFATLWRNGCGATRAPPDSGIVYGVVRDVRGGEGVPGARLTLSWSALALRDVMVDRAAEKEGVERRWTSETRSIADGSYVFCGVPVDATLRVRAATDSAASGFVAMESSALRVHRADLTVARPGERGIVVGYLGGPDGDPFADARLTLDDSLQARSEFDGRFVFPAVAAGTHQLVARYIGAAPVRATIEVAVGDTTIVAMTMSKVVRLTTMNVPSPDRARMLRAAYEARQIMYHRFILDSSFVARQFTMNNVFQTLPNVTVRQRGIGGFTLLVPDRHNGACVPDLRVDGVAINDFGQLAAVPTSRVAAVEVYPFATQIPPELQRGGIRYECGLVAVWTKWAFRIP